MSPMSSPGTYEHLSVRTAPGGTWEHLTVRTAPQDIGDIRTSHCTNSFPGNIGDIRTSHCMNGCPGEIGDIWTTHCTNGFPGDIGDIRTSHCIGNRSCPLGSIGNPALCAFLSEAEVPDGREFGEEGLRQWDHIVHARGTQRDVEGCGLRGNT